MKLEATIQSVEKSFDNLTKCLPREIVLLLKQRFEAFVQNLLKLDFTNISVDFVVDTNRIIRNLLRYARGGHQA